MTSVLGDLRKLVIAMSAKILIVDDHEVVREGVRTLISRARPQWQLCGEATNAREAIEACRTLKPDVTVLDITMPGMSGLEASSVMSALGCRVLIFTMHESEHLAAEVSQAGAQGFVLKSQAGKDLIRAIERLLGGGTSLARNPIRKKIYPVPHLQGDWQGLHRTQGLVFFGHSSQFRYDRAPLFSLLSRE
jgi:DNA-binding NarL/FixJ family response regulator